MLTSNWLYSQLVHSTSSRPIHHIHHLNQDQHKTIQNLANPSHGYHCVQLNQTKKIIYQKAICINTVCYSISNAQDFT
jgi:hypothetical protein